MSKNIYIYSTLSGDVDYTNHRQGGADLPIALPPVRINGGAGVANDRLVTPRGVMTRVTEENLDYLRANQVFQLHEANGFITVSEHQSDADDVAADMEARDNSAPLVPQDAIAHAGEDTMVVGGEAVTAAPTGGKRRK